MRFLIFILLGMSAFSQTKFEGIAIKASVPVGWQVQEENYGQIMLSNSNEQAAIMLIEHGWANEHVILQNMQETIHEDGMQATLATDIMQLDNGNYIALYQGSYSNGQEIILVVVVSKSKLWQIGGVITLVLVPKQAFKDSYQDLAVEISKSITYMPFMNSVAKQKANMFKGRKLVKYSSHYTSNYGGSISVGSNSKVTINFCSNGQFAFNGYSDLSAGGGAFDGQVSSNSKEGVGLWSLRLIKNYMVIRLVSNAGEVNYMPIERYTDDGAFYINGDKWVIGGSDLCN